jgi:hypothetical protein
VVIYYAFILSEPQFYKRNKISIMEGIVTWRQYCCRKQYDKLRHMSIWKEPQGRRYNVLFFLVMTLHVFHWRNVTEMYSCKLGIGRQMELVLARGEDLHLCAYPHIITQAELWVAVLLTSFLVATSYVWKATFRFPRICYLSSFWRCTRRWFVV